MDKQSVIQIIEKLESLNLKFTSSYVVEALLEPLLEFKLPIIRIEKGAVIVRSRILKEDEFICTNVREISFRTDNEIGLSRCNDENQSVFYSSLETERLKPLETNFLEVLPSNKEKIKYNIESVSGKWIFNVSVDLPFIGGDRNNPILCNTGKERFHLINDYAQKNPEYYECFQLVDDFLCREFSKKVSDEYEYKISAVYSRMLKDRNMIGVVYPSVKTNGAGLNVALFRESVELGIINCNMAIYSRFYYRNEIISNEHLMIANVDNDILRWYEDYNHKLTPSMKKYHNGESDDESCFNFIEMDDLGN